MKKGLTELVFIIDRSGSMCGLENETIGGFNSMIRKQKQVEGEAKVTTVLFDNRRELLHDHKAINDVNYITEDDYYVRGSTALLDALGTSISDMVSYQRKLDSKQRAEKIMFIITTDGLENSSREYGYRKVRHLIEKQKNQFGWEFIFLGANIDAVSEAARFGIREERAVRYHSDKKGTALNYQVLNDAVSELRNNREISKEWKARIEDDYNKRGGK